MLNGTLIFNMNIYCIYYIICEYLSVYKIPNNTHTNNTTIFQYQNSDTNFMF